MKLPTFSGILSNKMHHQDYILSCTSVGTNNLTTGNSGPPYLIYFSLDAPSEKAKIFAINKKIAKPEKPQLSFWPNELGAGL